MNRLVALTALTALCAACHRPTPPSSTSSEPEPVLEAVQRPHHPYRAVSVMAAGTVRGRVTFEGAPPVIPPVPVPAEGNPARCGATQTIPVLVVAPDHAVANAVLSLADVTEGKPTVPVNPVMDQRDCQFIPHVVAGVLGTSVRFTTSDEILHTAHGSYGYRGTEEWFNRATPPHVSVSATLDGEGANTVVCDASHPWMIAFVLGFAHPYFALTPASGEFVLDQVPAGAHRLHFWHEGFTPGPDDANHRPTYGAPVESEATVQVAAGSTTVVDFVLGPTGVRAVPR